MRKKIASGCYIIAMVASLVVGIWHFCVPYLYAWYSYVPDIPDILRISIDWINFFFSLFLVGYSVLLLMVRKQFFSGERTARIFYVFYLIVWLSRVLITVFYNWGWNIAVIGYIAGFSLEFLLILIPLLCVRKK